MRVLVTGSAGHLGEALMRTLRSPEYDAIGLDIQPSPYTRHVGSITDRRFVDHCMQGVAAVLHTATLHKPHIATHTCQQFIDTNVTGTLTLLEAAVAAGVGSFVYTSTTSAFGRALVPPPGEPAAWITEDVACVPKNIYGVTKVAAKQAQPRPLHPRIFASCAATHPPWSTATYVAMPESMRGAAGR